MRNERGVTLVGIIVSAAIVLSVLMFFAQSLALSRKHAAQARAQTVAQMFASEGLEFFARLNASQLNHFLGRNPVTGSTAVADRYQLCAHVNLLNRTLSSGTAPIYLNRDDRFDLPASILGRDDAKLWPNRFYQVRILNVVTGVVNNGACGGVAPFVLAPNERFLVTVGVSWIPLGSDTDEIKNASVSTLILR